MPEIKKLSILGDSISTYMGVSDDESANSSLIYNPYFYRDPFPLDRTYWKLVMDEFGFDLCVNNSWSGGNLSGIDDLASGVNRAKYLSRDDGIFPDIIIVFMGINDLGRGISAEIFASDYRKTLICIKNNYPLAKVFCVNLPDRDIMIKARTELFNAHIKAAVKDAGENFFIADLFESPMRGDRYYMNTLDGLHPDEDGMKLIADVLKKSIQSNFNI